MKFNVLFFGATADTVGARRVEIEADGLNNAADAFDLVFEKYPDLEKKHGRKNLHLSINQEYSDGTESLQGDDELAIFTAVSGG